MHTVGGCGDDNGTRFICGPSEVQCPSGHLQLKGCETKRARGSGVSRHVNARGVENDSSVPLKAQEGQSNCDADKKTLPRRLIALPSVLAEELLETCCSL